MQNKSISIIFGLLLAFGMGILVYATKKPVTLPSNITTAPTSQQTFSNNDDSDDGGAQTTQTPTIKKPNTLSQSITLSQIAAHSTRSSCWSAINGGVYDLTSWIPNHPGGEQAILSMCGKDGSNGFDRQHGGQSRPLAILAGFKIGTLTN